MADIRQNIPLDHHLSCFFCSRLPNGGGKAKGLKCWGPRLTVVGGTRAEV